MRHSCLLVSEYKTNQATSESCTLRSQEEAMNLKTAAALCVSSLPICLMFAPKQTADPGLEETFNESKTQEGRGASAAPRSPLFEKEVVQMFSEPQKANFATCACLQTKMVLLFFVCLFGEKNHPRAHIFPTHNYTRKLEILRQMYLFFPLIYYYYLAFCIASNVIKVINKKKHQYV